MVIQFASLAAVHGRSGVAVTEARPFAPLTAAVVCAGETANERAVRPACVTVNVSVPIVTVPVRAL